MLTSPFSSSGNQKPQLRKSIFSTRREGALAKRIHCRLTSIIHAGHKNKFDNILFLHRLRSRPLCSFFSVFCDKRYTTRVQNALCAKNCPTVFGKQPRLFGHDESPFISALCKCSCFRPCIQFIALFRLPLI